MQGLLCLVHLVRCRSQAGAEVPAAAAVRTVLQGLLLHASRLALLLLHAGLLLLALLKALLQLLALPLGCRSAEPSLRTSTILLW
jgi:hypothetical protein